MRQHGYAKKVAHCYARFFYVSMLSVCGALLFVSYQRRAGVEKESSGSFDPMMGAKLSPSGGSVAEEERSLRRAMPDPSIKSMAGEEGESPLHLPVAVPSVENLPDCGHGNFSMSVRASLQLLSFTIQRRSPAL
jgi:hypothetical protein